VAHAFILKNVVTEFDESIATQEGISSVRNSQPLDPARRLRRMHDQLLKKYGVQHWWPAEAEFEVVIGAYLTQNTSWKVVEASIENLRRVGALTIDGLRAIALDELQILIRPSGFQSRKAPALKAFVAMLDDEFGGSLDSLAATPTATLRERLLNLPGVGPETADAILLYAVKHPVPVADEYLRRIAERHRLIDPAPSRNRSGYDSLVQLTRRAFAPDPVDRHAQLFNEFHALTVAVGKAHCGRIARCLECPLLEDLSYSHRKKDKMPRSTRPAS
jgi:endonuclease-3 related protein